MKNKRSFLRLLAFEWRKNFLSPWLLVFLALLLVINGWKLNEKYQKKTDEFAPYQTSYEDFYARWSGTITADTVQELMEIYGPLNNKTEQMTISFLDGSGTYTYSEYGDYRFFFSQFANEMEYDYLYVNQAIDITKKAQDLEAFYKKNGNAYQAAESRAVAQKFYGRSISQFADTRYIEVWLHYDYSSMLVLLLCVFGLCGVFVTERETEMYMLQRTAKLGGSMTVAAKLTVSALFVVLICLVFYGEDFLVLQLLSGHWEALDSPVFAIRNLEATALNMTIGQFVVWSGLIKTLGMMCCGCLILLISCLCKRILSTFAFSAGILISLTALQEFCRTRVGLKWFNPLELVMVREIITDTAFVNVLGHPVIVHSFVIAGVVVTTTVLIAGILRFHPGRMERRLGHG